jgi:hypothetical protein
MCALDNKASINTDFLALPTTDLLTLPTTDLVARLQPLIAAVRQVQPRPLDAWEVAAILESLGYTDQLAQTQWGAADIRVLSQQVYQHWDQVLQNDNQVSQQQNQDHQKFPTASSSPASASTHKFFTELQIFLQQFSRSLSYSFAWLLITFSSLGSTIFGQQQLTTQAAIVLNIALMLSLITSGGFIQIIVKQGYFYTAIAQPALAGNELLRLLRLLLLTTVLIGGGLVAFGFYRHPFADEYILVGVLYYLLFSVLWGLASVLSLQQRPRQLVAVFGAFLVTLLIGNLQSINGLVSYLVALVVANVVAGLQTLPFWQAYHRERAKLPTVLPRRAAMIFTLTPYFIYGSGYFCFLFTDRLMAGLAVAESESTPFLINLAYQHSLDYALLALMLTSPVAEYGNDYLMRQWRQLALQLPLAAVEQRQTVLQQLYRRVITRVMGVFGLLSLASAGLLYLQQPLSNWALFIAGIIGYGLFSYGLTNSLLLFSLGKLPTIVRTLIVSLLINLTLGYLAGQIWGSDYAATGLTVAAGLFAAQSYQLVKQVLAAADYAFYCS